jgi:hypothetical protein
MSNEASATIVELTEADLKTIENIKVKGWCIAAAGQRGIRAITVYKLIKAGMLVPTDRIYNDFFTIYVLA